MPAVNPSDPPFSSCRPYIADTGIDATMPIPTAVRNASGLALPNHQSSRQKAISTSSNRSTGKFGCHWYLSRKIAKLARHDRLNSSRNQPILLSIDSWALKKQSPASAMNGNGAIFETASFPPSMMGRPMPAVMNTGARSSARSADLRIRA